MLKYNLTQKYTDIILPACANTKVDNLDLLIDAINEKDLLRICKKNEISSIVGHYLLENCNGRKLLPEWSKEIGLIRNRTGAYLKELSRIAAIFNSKGIKLIGLKNCGIASNLIKNPSLFPMGDVDVLISKEKFRKAHEILILEGYKLKSPNKYKKADFDEGYLNGSNEYEKELEVNTKLWFELLWRPVDGRFIADSQEMKGAELIESCVYSNKSNVYNLSPVYNLLQVCIHTAKHSYVRAPGFRLHLDVHRIVWSTEIDWPLFLCLAKKHRVCTISYFSLIIPKIVFRTPIPNEIIKELSPRSWKESLIWYFINRGGIFFPSEQKFNLLYFIFFTILLHDGLGTIFEIFLKSGNGHLSRKNGLKGYCNWFRRLYKLVFHHTMK